MRKIAVLAVAVLAASLYWTLGAGALTGSFTEVSPPVPGGDVEGYDINDAGQVTGVADFADGRYAFVRDADGTFRRLASPEVDGEVTEAAVATALNSAGDVAGHVGVGGRLALVWPAGGDALDLGRLPADTDSWAVDINDAGLTVGISAQYDPCCDAPQEWRSWVRDPNVGVLVDLGTLPGGGDATVVAINDAGVATGSVRYPGTGTVGFTWTQAGGMVAIPLPAHEGSFVPSDINNVGQVVGRGRNRSFVWDPADGYVALSRIGDEDLNGDVWEHSINDDGLVVGSLLSVDDSSAPLQFKSRPMAWDSATGDAAILPIFPEGEESAGLTAVNNDGIAVGNSGIPVFGYTGATFLLQISPAPVASAPPASAPSPALAEPTFTG